MKTSISDAVEAFAASLVGKSVRLRYWKKFKVVDKAQVLDYDDEPMMLQVTCGNSTYRVFSFDTIEIAEEQP
jgi:hypothetical protein